jgi:hypothetical protein
MARLADRRPRSAGSRPTRGLRWGRRLSLTRKTPPAKLHLKTKALVAASRAEPRHQVVGLAGKHLPHAGDVVAAAPGAAVDDQAGRAFVQVEQTGDIGVGVDGADPALGLGPGDVFQQPGARRDRRQVGGRGVRRGLQADQAALQGEGSAAGVVKAFQLQQLAARRQLDLVGGRDGPPAPRATAGERRRSRPAPGSPTGCRGCSAPAHGRVAGPRTSRPACGARSARPRPGRPWPC